MSLKIVNKKDMVGVTDHAYHRFKERFPGLAPRKATRNQIKRIIRRLYKRRGAKYNQNDTILKEVAMQQKTIILAIKTESDGKELITSVLTEEMIERTESGLIYLPN